jgi:phosphatidylinositol glycan class O
MWVQRHNKLTSIEDSDHLVGIYLFMRGLFLSRWSFLLSRLAPNRCLLTRYRPPTYPPSSSSLIPSDSNFLFPHPPQSCSPYHHNVLTLPRELTANQRHCNVSRVSSQTLPTFMDIGYNFGGALIGEDSIIQQLQQANKTVCLPQTCVLIGSHQTSLLQVAFIGDNVNN